MKIKKAVLLLFLFVFGGCVATEPPSPKVEAPASSMKQEENIPNPISSVLKQPERRFELKSDTYVNELYGFSVKVPENTIVDERDGSTRLQNYSFEEDRVGLKPGEYYLEISISDVAQPSCAEQIVNGMKVTVGDASGYRGLGYEGGDAGGKRFALCLEESGQYYYIQATENSNTGPIANEILDFFVLTR